MQILPLYGISTFYFLSITLLQDKTIAGQLVLASNLLANVIWYFIEIFQPLIGSLKT